jgi:dinuclear metal center YbgI/SA1388 family protein
MSVTVNDICCVLEDFAPLALQESYDNAGLQIGNPQMEVSGVLLCIDITEKVLHEAVDKNCNMVISHHPLIFGGLRSITAKTETERCVHFAIRNEMAIYACHTNIDSASGGVSKRMADKLGLKNCRVLEPKTDMLSKLVVYVPFNFADKVRDAIFEVGAGQIGNYDCCSYNSEGKGSFRAKEGSNPFVGEQDKVHFENEVRIEVILPGYLKMKVTEAILSVHPYEEPAFDFLTLKNDWNTVGFGVIGELSEPMDEKEFLLLIKEKFNLRVIKHSALRNKKIQKVAVCGGSGATLIKRAMAQNADMYISADFKYHDFFIVENKITIADIGHFESEQFTKEIFFEQLSKKFPKFAVHFSEVNTNPINFL